jgi:hypothetical protein
MPHTAPLGSPTTNTRMRSPAHLAQASGMCAACTADCTGPCEIGLSALRGAEALLPFGADVNQFASEKAYPLDFSHFAINGRVFGAQGLAADPAAADPAAAVYSRADIGAYFGLAHPVPCSAPIILPAMAKLAWREYFAGAALSGVPVVIGEDVLSKDPGLVMDGQRVVEAPLVAEMVSAFNRYRHGLGDIILQANCDDEHHGLLDYAIAKLGVVSVELKFGQAAKGIQGMGRVPKIEDALRFKRLGWLVLPDPEDPSVAAAHARGEGPHFEKIGRLPMWDEASLFARVARLRELGAKRICFKSGPFAPHDIARILRIASEAGIDLVTLDGAGGGTGHSPVRMMDEWGVPAVNLECAARKLLIALEAKEKRLPQVAIAGGFATEDQVFKGLALGAPHIGFVAVGRAAMAAAMVGKRVGEALARGEIPKGYERFGSTVEEVFADYRLLKAEYGPEAAKIPCGAIGVFTYLNRLSSGMRMLMALNRKFSLRYIGREDILPLTAEAIRVSGLPTYEELAGRALEELPD